MFYQLHIFLITVFFSVNLAAGDISPVSDSVKNISDNKPSIISPEKNAEKTPNYVELEKELIDGFSEILHYTLHSNPAAASIIYREKDMIVKDLVKSLQVGAHITESKDQSGNGEKIIPENNAVYNPILIDSNKIVYTRLDSFTTEGMAKLHESVCSIMRYARKPDGMILDLRKCSDSSSENAVKLLSMFKDDEKLFNSKDFKKIKPFLFKITLPLIVIVGKETKGSPEIFTNLIKNFSGIVSIGSKTSGSPFPFNNIKLKNGAVLKLPVIPEVLADIPPYTVSPDIDIKPVYPVLPYKKLREGEPTSKDRAINRAAEILLCLHALTKKKKKTNSKSE